MSLVSTPAVRRGVGLLAASAIAWTPVALATAHGQSAAARPALATPTAATAHHASTRRAVHIPAGLHLYQQRKSLLGIHRWYQQRKNRHVVVNGWYAVHLWKNGSTTIWDGRKHVRKLAAGNPQVTATGAARRVDSRDKRSATPHTSGGLMVLPAADGGAAHLVWQVLTTDGTGVTASYVDAATGQTLRTTQLAKDLAPTSRKHRRTWVTGAGRVFDPNPVVKLQKEGLKDHHDANSAVPNAGYTEVTLHRLDHSHSLKGRWARIINSNRATSSTNVYRYRRHNQHFEQVNTYHAVDHEQSYLRRLGLYHVNAESQKLKTNAFPDDNSFYDPSVDQIWLGTGGVDDAEDPEVIWHEYGHAMQDAQVPDFGQTIQAGSIGEGFGDYMAAVLSQATDHPNDTAKTPAACLMDWDSTSYTTGTPHCIRRTDLDLDYRHDRDGEVHDDGQIWSGALWRMYQDLYVPGPLSRAKATHIHDVATRIIVEAQFDYTPTITMPQAARVTVQTAKRLYPDDPSIARTTREAFESRHILPAKH